MQQQYCARTVSFNGTLSLLNITWTKKKFIFITPTVPLIAFSQFITAALPMLLCVSFGMILFLPLRKNCSLHCRIINYLISRKSDAKELGTWNLELPSSFCWTGPSSSDRVPFFSRNLELGTRSFLWGTCPALCIGGSLYLRGRAFSQPEGLFE